MSPTDTPDLRPGDEGYRYKETGRRGVFVAVGVVAVMVLYVVLDSMFGVGDVISDLVVGILESE